MESNIKFHANKKKKPYSLELNQTKVNKENNKYPYEAKFNTKNQIYEILHHPLYQAHFVSSL